MAKSKFELIVTIIDHGYSDEVMKHAKAVGATGGTVLHARGTGDSEIAQLFGITIQPEKEFVLILAPVKDKEAIMQAIAKGAGLTTNAKGIVFSMPVDDVVGVFEKPVAKVVEPKEKIDSEQNNDEQVSQ